MNPAKPDCLNDEKVRALHTINQPTTIHLSLSLYLYVGPSLIFLFRCFMVGRAKEGKRLLKETYKRLFQFFGATLDLL